MQEPLHGLARTTTRIEQGTGSRKVSALQQEASDVPHAGVPPRELLEIPHPGVVLGRKNAWRQFLAV